MAQDQVHPHPLFIELVLENVFKNLSKHSLFNCRRVCSKWYHESSKYFKALRAYVHVDTSDSLYQLISTYVNCNETSRPCFHLAIDWAELDVHDLELLFEVLGSNITSVSIPPAQVTKVRNVLETLLRLVPHLQEFEFQELQETLPYVRGDPDRIRRNGFTVFILSSEEPRNRFHSLTTLKLKTRMESRYVQSFATYCFEQLLLAMPSLKSFEVTIMEVCETSTVLSNLSQALKICPQASTSLKSLTSGTVNNRVLEAIVEGKMQLEELSLVNMIRYVPTEALEQVLRSQAPYLRCLALGGASSRTGRRIQLTGLGPPFELPNLTEFKLIGELVAGKSSADQLQVVNWRGLDWRLQMPKLEKLVLIELRRACFVMVFGSGLEEISEEVKSLILKVREEVPDADQLRRLAKAFPGLTELEVVVDSAESIGLVFLSWPKLKKLKLSIVGDIPMIDEVFTGLQFKEAVEAEGYEVPPECETFEDAGVDGEIGGITNLTELEYLNVEFRKAVVFGQRSGRWSFSKTTGHAAAEDSHLISDVTGTLALLMMRKLNAVCISKSNMSRDLVNILRTELSLEICAIKDQYGEIIPPISILN